MRRLLATLIGLLGAACGGSDAPARAGQHTDARTIRLELPVAPDVVDVPRLMARDALLAKGYTVEVSSYNDNMIAIQAMLGGDLDFARVPMPQAFSAIQQGAALTIVVAGGDHTRILVSVPSITTCAGLHNQQVAVPNMVSSQTLSLKRFLATRCGKSRVELVVITGVENRLAALLGHRVAAALLESANLFELEHVHGSKFHVLADLAAEFPGINGAAMIAPLALIQTHRAIVRDFVRETILASRQVVEPEAMTRAIEKYLRSPAERAAHAAKSNLDRRVLDVNGGLSDTILQANIDFYVEAGVLKPGLTPAQVADRSHLNAVLDELGRR